MILQLGFRHSGDGTMVSLKPHGLVNDDLDTQVRTLVKRGREMEAVNLLTNKENGWTAMGPPTVENRETKWYFSKDEPAPQNSSKDELGTPDQLHH